MRSDKCIAYKGIGLFHELGSYAVGDTNVREHFHHHDHPFFIEWPQLKREKNFKKYIKAPLFFFQS